MLVSFFAHGSSYLLHQPKQVRNGSAYAQMTKSALRLHVTFETVRGVACSTTLAVLLCSVESIPALHAVLARAVHALVTRSVP